MFDRRAKRAEQRGMWVARQEIARPRVSGFYGKLDGTLIHTPSALRHASCERLSEIGARRHGSERPRVARCGNTDATNTVYLSSISFRILPRAVRHETRAHQQEARAKLQEDGPRQVETSAHQVESRKRPLQTTEIWLEVRAQSFETPLFQVQRAKNQVELRPHPREPRAHSVETRINVVECRKNRVEIRKN